MEAPNLAQIIAARKGNRSYERLSKDAGGYPSANRIQQLATRPLQSKFPDPDTIRGLASALGVTVTEIVLSSARSVGLQVAVEEPTALTIAGAGALPEDAQDILLGLARELSRMSKPINGGAHVAQNQTATATAFESEDGDGTNDAASAS